MFMPQKAAFRHPYGEKSGLGYRPTTKDPDVRKQRGELTKREAERRKDEIMERINQPVGVLQSQVRFGDFLGVWLEKHVQELGAATQAKYETHVRNHIRPAFDHRRMFEVNTEAVQDFINKSELGWWAKLDLKNILSSVFSKAIDWGYWEDRNPIDRVQVRGKRIHREKRILTDEEVELLLTRLPAALQLIIEIIRWTSTRISEVLGLQWKHVDLENGWIHIRQRWYRGDLDVPKSRRSHRDLPLGYVVGLLRELQANSGAGQEAFVFDRGGGEPYDDRALMKDYLRPAAKELGFYFEGFGFHSFRRGGITTIQEVGASTIEASLYAGHSRPAVTAEYTKLQRARLEELVLRMQKGERKVIPFKKPVQSEHDLMANERRIAPGFADQVRTKK